MESVLKKSTENKGVNCFIDSYSRFHWHGSSQQNKAELYDPSVTLIYGKRNTEWPKMNNKIWLQAVTLQQKNGSALSMDITET